MAVALATDVHAQQASAPPAARPISFIARNTTRLEMWSFFAPGGAVDPDYAHVGNACSWASRATARAWTSRRACSTCSSAGCRANAIGPGPLGAGAAYFQHAGRSDSRQLYLRTMNAQVQARAARSGRAAWSNGVRVGSRGGVGRRRQIEAVKRSGSTHASWASSSGLSTNARSTGSAWTGREARRASRRRRSTRRRAGSRMPRACRSTTCPSSAESSRSSRGGRFAARSGRCFRHYYDDTRVVTGTTRQHGRAARRGRMCRSRPWARASSAPRARPQGRSMRSAGLQARAAHGTSSRTARGRWPRGAATSGRGAVAALDAGRGALRLGR